MDDAVAEVCRKIMKSFFLSIFLCLVLISLSHGELKVVGFGETMRLDPSGFPENRKAEYEIMRVKCVKCHSLERVVFAVKTGIAPISGQPFDLGATKAYGVKMLRKPDSNMNKKEVKAVVELLNYLLEEAER
jgi:hypothetical protein